MLNDTDMERYFRVVDTGDYSSLWEIEVNLLNGQKVTDETLKFRDHPIVDRLNGVVLDDPNTSNHHVLLRRSPIEGYVLYLAHDDDSRVVFSSLAEFLACADRAKRENVSLPELHPALSPLMPKQAELSCLIRSLIAEDQVDVALTLVPSMDLSDKDLLGELIAHDDFFLGEAVANAIRLRPAPELVAISKRCAEHRHSQVAKAGKRALAECGK